MPQEFGNWHTIYVRMLRWSEKGVLQKLFEALQMAGIIEIRMQIIHLDSTPVRVHQDATGVPKKRANNTLGVHAEETPRKFTWSPHLTERLFASRFHQETDRHDVPCGEELMIAAHIPQSAEYCAMDKGYEGDRMRLLVMGLGLTPVVPPKSNRSIKWDNDKEI